ncbi:hypothetical protein CLOSBL3_12525 [Clostridiaceae bacterium BL-3]|nr:hypothetical protein CLOSBL3_12525 [Clostridiaceae bacterium BL-3]
MDPFGHYVNESVWNKEEIIYADINMDQVPLNLMKKAFSFCDILN